VRRGRQLASQLRDRLAPGGVVLRRFGKSYPGESLPRWALDVIGHHDGRALWPDREVVDVATIEEAQRIGTEIAAELGIPAELHAAFEDPWEVLRAEAGLPVDIDPRTAGLDDPEERRRLVATLDRGVGSIVGYALPLKRQGEGGGWITKRWEIRRGQLFLVPGDSPLGLRLPLDSLVAAEPITWADAPDLPDPRRDAPDEGQSAQAAPAPEKPPVDPRAGMRTTLAIEPRDGQLWVFLPPVERFADFCALVEAIDRVRASTGTALHLEGYSPPPSHAMRRFAITPDPGVLEVNLPPATSSREATHFHHEVFEAALASGLTAERYLLDGRAAGSGGGNHITIGGPRAEQSPWFQRPDLLASLITFVQCHPSLSYLFSGLFCGPTSQAPRVDEARHDALYELELALPRMYERHPSPAAWEVDALLRHLLVDVAGSTHRAELSIDKLFDPGTSHGRQGLVELRAFEMPPHPRMAAAQAILIRSLIAAFTVEPFKHALVRWGGELHDRFLLPYWMWRDFEDVLGHLAQHGVPLPVEAFRPFCELRCPLVGTISAEVGLSRPNAIELWHVSVKRSRRAAGALRRLVDGADRAARSASMPNAICHGQRRHRAVRQTSARDIRVARRSVRGVRRTRCIRISASIIRSTSTSSICGATRCYGGAYHVWHPGSGLRCRAAHPRRGGRAPRATVHRTRSQPDVARPGARGRAASRAAVHARPSTDRSRLADAARRGLGDVTFDASFEVHDELLARRNVDVWVGAEPTFTRADSTDPAWLGAAEGDDKLARAHALACKIADQLPHARVTRVLGRTYPDEPAPRFAWGVRWSEVAGTPGHRPALDAEPTPPPIALAGDHWLTVTPDPGVVEVNMAPCANVDMFVHQAQLVWSAASAAGMSPIRHRFNGDVADSGGGGQITLGGPSPETSPFLRYPHVLPRCSVTSTTTRRSRTGSRASASARRRKAPAPTRARANAGTSSR
jgi:uncharacterized protein (DUF2126 family)